MGEAFDLASSVIVLFCLFTGAQTKCSNKHARTGWVRMKDKSPR